jgi:RND family efflux transporter MFP subunit
LIKIVNAETKAKKAGYFSPMLALGLGIPVALLTVGFVPHAMRVSKLNDEVAQRKSEPPTVVVVRPRAATDPGLVLPGSSLATQEVVLQARGTGYVTHSYVDIGSVVKSGQVLATLQAPDVDAQYHQAVSQTQQSAATVLQSQATELGLEASARQAKAQYQASLSGLTQTKATAASYSAKVTSAQKALRQAQANLRYDQAQQAFAEREMARFRSLGAAGYATIEQVEQQAATAKSAKAKVEADQEAIQIAMANITDAQAGYRAAVAAVDSAGFNVTSASENVNVARQALLSGQRLIDVNRAALGAASENTKRYDALLKNQAIVAPFDGVITARNVEIGSLVNASTTPVADTDPNNTAPTSGLYGLARIDPIEVSVQLPQTYFSAVQLKQPVDVSFREIPNQVFRGQISAVSGALDATSRTLQVKVRVPNPTRQLRPGLYADVHFSALKADPVLRVPSTAFLSDSKGTRVAVVTPDDHIRLQSVQVGRDFGDEAEIIQGLKPGEMVVVMPSDTLTPGLAVKPSERDVMPVAGSPPTNSRKG